MTVNTAEEQRSIRMSPDNRPLAFRVQGLGRRFEEKLDLTGQNLQATRNVLFRLFGISLPVRKQTEGVVATYARDYDVLKNISFEIAVGEIVVLAGASGAGKTTLLQLLAGAIPPTKGRIERYGRFSALLQVGENLDGTRSALQNIETQVRWLGLSAEAARAYTRRVLNFAQLPDGFESVPVERYSSGMKARLELALTLESDAAILLIDDVLGVGDIEFQLRCADKLVALSQQGRTIVTAIDDEEVVRRIASRMMVLVDGQIASDVFETRARTFTSEADVRWRVSNYLPSNDVTSIRSIDCKIQQTETGRHLEFQMLIETRRRCLEVRPYVDLMKGNSLFFRSLFPEYIFAKEPQLLSFNVELPIEQFALGDYSIQIAVVALEGGLVHAIKAAQIVELEVLSSQETAPSQLGWVVRPWQWELKSLTDEK